MSKYLVQVKDGKLVFSSLAHEKYFYRTEEGKKFKIDEFNDDPRTIGKLQRTFSGPITQYFFYQHEKGVYNNFDEARETLKLIGNPKEVYDPRTRKKIVVGGSTSGKTAKWWHNFFKVLEHYFLQNGYLFPDTDEYLDWAEKGRTIDDVYPPLKVLIDNYNRV